METTTITAVFLSSFDSTELSEDVIIESNVYIMRILLEYCFILFWQRQFLAENKPRLVSAYLFISKFWSSHLLVRGKQKKRDRIAILLRYSIFFGSLTLRSPCGTNPLLCIRRRYSYSISVYNSELIKSNHSDIDVDRNRDINNAHIKMYVYVEIKSEVAWM